MKTISIPLSKLSDHGSEYAAFNAAVEHHTYLHPEHEIEGWDFDPRWDHDRYPTAVMIDVPTVEDLNDEKQ